MAVILGLNFSHADSAACLIKDGELIAAAEEERFTRVKHDSAFPRQAAEFCVKNSGNVMGDIDFVAVNGCSSSNLLPKIFGSISSISSFARAAGSMLGGKASVDRNEQFIRRSLPEIRCPIVYYEHHLCHQASALWASGIDGSLGISLDGFGDYVSGSVATFDGGFRMHKRVFFPHSLGIFYQAFCQLIGFPRYGDEYKVMGLAAYGSKSQYCPIVESMVGLHGDKYELDLKYFRHHTSEFKYEISGGIPVIDQLYAEDLCDRLGVNPREPNSALTSVHKNIAFAVQRHFEIIVLQFIERAREDFSPNNRHLSLSGGCAMNSVANGKILSTKMFDDMFVQPAGGDSGGALGAAVLHACQIGDIKSVKKNAFCPYLGSSYSNDEAKEFVMAHLGKSRKEYLVMECVSFRDLLEIIVPKLASGKIIGWFRGRSEWGPRALGNRSIFASACLPNIKELINSKIKRRESFRPFAPMVPIDDAAAFFDVVAQTPFMTHVFEVHQDKRELLPAVTHADGSARVQTVDGENGTEEIYELLKAFGQMTGIPVLINTSFNENEPVVNHPREALECFLRTSMDLVVIENMIIERVN